MADHIGFEAVENRIDCREIDDVTLMHGVARQWRQECIAGVLEAHEVVGIEVVDPRHLMPVRQELAAEVHADETRCARNQNFHCLDVVLL